MKTKLLFTLLFIGTFAYSQEFELVEPVEIYSEPQQIEIIVDGVLFSAYVSSTGAHYILKESSKSGKLYKVYFGYATGKVFQEKTVYTDKESERFWILGITSGGSIKRIYVRKS